MEDFRTSLRRTVAIPIIALAILASVLLWETHSLNSALQWVDHTDQVIAASEQLIKLMIDMESGIRGYLNSGTEEFLQPYNEAKPIIDSKFDALNQLVSDNPAQQARLAGIRSRFDAWRSYQAGRVELRRSTGARLEPSLQGKLLMDSVRAEHDAFVQSEAGLRTERVQRARRAFKVVTVTCALMTLLIGAFIASFTRWRMHLLAGNFQHAEEDLVEAKRQAEDVATQLRTIVDSMTERLYVCDVNGVPILANAAYRDYGGGTGLPVFPKAFMEVMEAFDLSGGAVPAENWPIARALRGERVRGFELLVRFKQSGQEQICSYNASPVFDSEGKVAMVVLTSEDITERKRAEKALRESQAQFRTLADAIPQLCWMANADGGIFWYNERWYEYTGTTPKEMEGWGWQSVHNPDTLPQVLERWKGSIATGEPFNMVFPLRGGDGVFRPFLTRVMPVKDASGRVVRWFGTNTDVTELRDAQEALRMSEERWATTLRSIGDAVISTDATGKVDFMNEVAERLTGWSWEEAKGRDLTEVFDIVQEVTRIRPESPVEKVIRLGQVVGLANHTALIRRDGVELPIEDSGAPIRNPEGQIEGVVLVFHDVSEQRKIEKALRASDRLATTGRLAATIAHEIHNPLDAVGNLLFLIGEGGPGQNVRTYVSMASQELTRVTQMTQQMLTFQRESAKPVPVKIGEILNSVAALYERKIQVAGVHLKQEIDFDGHILALPGELRQVFANLVGNAIEAVSARQGRITVRAYASQDRRLGRPGVRVVVADDGPGIPAQVRANIFEPFFTTKGESGTGLGLWITSDILRKYEGTIQLRSRTDSGCSGTCFSVFLPFGNEDLSS